MAVHQQSTTVDLGLLPPGIMITATNTTAVAEHSTEHDIASSPSPAAVDTAVHTLEALIAFLDPEDSSECG